MNECRNYYFSQSLMYRIGKSIEIESRLVIFWDWVPGIEECN